MEINELDDSYQSSLRRDQSIETVDVYIDITKTLIKDPRLVLFDSNLYAVFYVTNDALLLKCVEFSFSIKDTASSWTKSYLSNITQCVSISGRTSPRI